MCSNKTLMNDSTYSLARWKKSTDCPWKKLKLFTDNLASLAQSLTLHSFCPMRKQGHLMPLVHFECMFVCIWWSSLGQGWGLCDFPNFWASRLMTEKHNRGHLAMSRHKVILSCCTNRGRPRSLTHIFANEFTAAANDINCGKGHHSLMAPPSYSVCGYGKKQRAKGKNAAGHFYYLGKTQLIFLQANKTELF